MGSLKRTLPEIRFSGAKVTSDEIDANKQYSVIHPSVDPLWFGTAAVGTAGQAKAFVLTNIRADYPRNLVVSDATGAGTAHGGTATVNGKDQFGNSITESITVATAAAGGTVAGTKVFASVSSGTFNFATAAVGNGTTQLGVAIGTSTALQHLFGLPDKILGTADVKNITWVNNGTSTTVNGGTIGAYVGTANHTFQGTAVVAVTDKFVVTLRSTFNPEEATVNTL
ncbi:MAG: hypothetical protein AAB922_05520 [Patescibacteria group bacterium]